MTHRNSSDSLVEKRTPYDTLDQSSDDESSVTLLASKWVKYPDRRRGWRTPALAATCFILVAAALGALTYISVNVHKVQQQIHLFPTGKELGHCGTAKTVEEARALGCKFDPMSWLWVRPECYDAELIDDFFNRTQWDWYTDWQLKPETKIPIEEVFAGSHPHAFTYKKYHWVHCTYMWRKMHKALLEHRPVDTDLTSWHHTKHCEKVLTDDYLHEDVDCTADKICPTYVRATWTSCGYF